MEKVVSQEWVDHWVGELADSINCEIDQELLLEAGVLDPSNMVDYRDEFKKKFFEEMPECIFYPSPDSTCETSTTTTQ